jgi:hypothetical protein
LRSETHKLINLICNKELPQKWNESFVIPIHMKDENTDCSNYRGISLLSTSYKISSNVLLARLTPYAEEITGECQRELRRNRSKIDHIFCMRQVLEKIGV